MIKRLRTAALLGMVLATFTGVVFGPAAHAAQLPWPPPFSDPAGTNFGRTWGTGYYTGQNVNVDIGISLCQSRWTWPTGWMLNTPDDGSFAYQFETKVYNDLFANPDVPPAPGNPMSDMSGCPPGDVGRNQFLIQANATRTGTAMMINTMLGYQGADFGSGQNSYVTGITTARARYNDWVKLINEYQAIGAINWNAAIDYQAISLNGTRADSTGVLNGTDTAFYGNKGPDYFKNYITFNKVNANGTVDNSVNGVLYAINKGCGNVTGNVKPPPFLDGTYTLKPTATPSVDDTEDPTVATFRDSIDVSTNTGPVKATTKREYYVKRGAGKIWTSNVITNTNQAFTRGTYTYNFPTYQITTSSGLPSLQAGDLVCASLSVNPGSGTVDPAGNMSSPGALKNTSPDQCVAIVAKPYIKAFGNDVSTGAGFSSGVSTCTPTNDKATLLTLGKNALGLSFSGSGSQLGAYALGEISGFTSAGSGARRSDQTIPSPPVGLTFGNYGNPSIGSAVPNTDSKEVKNYGGKGGIKRCIPDYYGKAASGGADIDNTTTSKTYNSATPLPDAVEFTRANSYVQIDGLNAVTGQHVIAVNGDVYITGNINYAGYGGGR